VFGLPPHLAHEPILVFAAGHPRFSALLSSRSSAVCSPANSARAVRASRRRTWASPALRRGTAPASDLVRLVLSLLPSRRAANRPVPDPGGVPCTPQPEHWSP